MKVSFKPLRIITTPFIMVSMLVLAYYAFALNSLILSMALGAYSFVMLELYYIMRKKE